MLPKLPSARARGLSCCWSPAGWQGGGGPAGNERLSVVGRASSPEPGLREAVCCKLSSLLPSYPPVPLPPFPLISQVCSISALPLPKKNIYPGPNPQLGKRSVKAASAAVPLTLPSDPQNVGTLIPRSLISQATLYLWA